MKTKINKSTLFNLAWGLKEQSLYKTFGECLTAAYKMYDNYIAVLDTEVKEPIEEVMEMDMAMFDVVSTPQTKLFNHNPELFVARANHRAFNKSL